MPMSPFAAAGMLEVAHQLGLLPRIQDSTRHAMIAGLVGYGLGQNSTPDDSRAAEREARMLRFHEMRARILAENAARQRDYDEHLHRVLENAALAHNAR